MVGSSSTTSTEPRLEFMRPMVDDQAPVAQGLNTSSSIVHEGRLLDRDQVDGLDLRVLGQKVAADLRKPLGDLAVDVGLPAVLVLEGVKDAVGGVVDLERVPGHGAFLGLCEAAALLKEGSELIRLVGPGLQQGEVSELHGHDGSFRCVGWVSLTVCAAGEAVDGGDDFRRL